MAIFCGSIRGANAGGTSLSTPAEDGDTSYLGQPYAWISPSFVHVGRPSRTCWHIRLSFLPLLITIIIIMISSWEMKWESSLPRDRLRSVCLSMPIPSLQKLVASLGDEFPMLQYLRIEPLTRCNTHLILPTFEVPHLRHLILNHLCFSNQIDVTSSYYCGCADLRSEVSALT